MTQLEQCGEGCGCAADNTGGSGEAAIVETTKSGSTTKALVRLLAQGSSRVRTDKEVKVEAGAMDAKTTKMASTAALPLHAFGIW